MIVTSFSPTRIEAQLRALETWKKYNVDIVAVQCHDDNYLEPFLPHISRVHEVDPNTYWSKPTPSITSILELATQPIFLVNSDIELEIEHLPTRAPKTLSIGLRTEYHPTFTQPNKYGIDTFLLTPEMVPHLINPIWALGIPGWDYYVLYKLHLLGFSLSITRDHIRHEVHKEQWNRVDYNRCTKLLEFEFNIPMKELSDNILKLTDRTHLVKKSS